MNFLRTIIFSAVLAPECLFHGVAATPTLNPLSDKRSLQPLKAATRRSEILRRTADTNPVHEAELIYASGENADGQTPLLSSTVRFQSRKPVIILENVEHLFREIQCSGTAVDIEFHDHSTFLSVLQSWSDVEDGYIIVSQMGCVEEGTRAPFRINSMKAVEEHLTVTLTTTAEGWHEAFQSVHLSFGTSMETHEFYRHDKLHRRQDSPTPASPNLSATTIIPSMTATATATSLSIDLSHQFNDSWFPGLETDVDPLPISISCQECQTAGSLQLTQGEWKLLSRDEWANLTNLTDIFSAGYMELEVKDLLAQVVLGVSPSLTGDHSFTLFTIPVFGFSVPGIGAAGILIDPQLELSWELSGGLELSCGFELNVPDLQITLDFANPESSSVTGLDKISVKGVPFQANISDIELSLGLSLTPRITLELELLDAITIQAGANLDLPKTTLTVTQLTTDTVDAECEKFSEAPAFQADFEHLFQNLTHIETDIGLEVGFDLQGKVSLLDKLDYSSSWSLATIPVTALPTQCLAFETDAPSASAFTPAASAYASVEKAAASSASSASGSRGGSASASATGSAKNSAPDLDFFTFRSLTGMVWFYALLLVAGVFVRL